MADINALMQGVGAAFAPVQSQLNSIWGQLPGEFQTYLNGMGISGTATTPSTPTPPPAPGVATTPAAPSHRAGGKNPFTPGVPYTAPQPAAAATPANPFTGGDDGGGGGAANTFASYAPPNWDDYARLASVQGSGISYDGTTYYDWNLDPTNSMGYGTGARVGSPFTSYGDYGSY